MAFIFDTNIYVKDGFTEVPIYHLKELLKTAGWTVPRSSDGLTYNPSGDVITSASRGIAGGMGNDYAWIVVHSPDGHEWLFARGLGSDNTQQDWQISVSRSAGFSGGTPSNIVPPTASDEGVINAFGSFISVGGAQSCRYNIGVEDVAPYRFWAAPLATNTYGNLDGVIIHDTLFPAPGALLDADPFVYTVISMSYGYVAHSFGYSRAGTSLQHFYQMTFDLYQTNGVNMFNAKDDLVWIEYKTPTPNRGQGIKGYSSMLRQVTVTRPSGTLLTKSTSGDLIIMGTKMAAPWDGTLPRRDF